MRYSLLPEITGLEAAEPGFEALMFNGREAGFVPIFQVRKAEAWFCHVHCAASDWPWHISRPSLFLLYRIKGTSSALLSS